MLSTSVAADAIALSPVAVSTAGTVIEARTLTHIAVGGGSVIVTYSP
ncbi:MAG: hypothetical protein ABWY23_10645 [Mycetocola sp.]